MICKLLVVIDVLVDEYATPFIYVCPDQTCMQKCVWEMCAIGGVIWQYT
jgi:hypothetical protein